VCIPLFQKYFPIAQLEYGAKNYRKVGFEAMVATIMQYFKALIFECHS
jgi:hypothetical protein